MPSNSVFISHSSADRVFVEAVLLPALKEAEIAAWYSPTDIRSSQDWERSILEGLESSDWFLVVVSPRAQASEWVRDEVMWAVERRAGKIVPIMVESCDPRAIHIRLARIQHVDFRISHSDGLTRLLAALGHNASPEIASGHQRSIRACRLAPFYFGGQPHAEYSEAFGFPSYDCGGARVLMVGDSFGVALLEEEVHFKDPVDFLLRRRARHLELLQTDSPLVAALRVEQRNFVATGLVDELPIRLPYVMSVHWVIKDSVAVSEVELRCLADPSTLGISDDPLDPVDATRIENAKQTLRRCSGSAGSIDIIRNAENSYLVSWANVLLVTGNADRLEYERLVGIEARLQHLWYRLHLYSKGMERLIDRLGAIDFAVIREEILRTRLQFAQFCRVDPTGATHLNDLRESLVRTSKLRELYEEFCLGTRLIDELEGLR